ncbi:MAG: glycosyltransferase family 2 protein [Nocardioides sp.]
MLEPLTSALLVSAALLVVATVLLFTVRDRDARTPHLPLTTAVAGAVVVALAALGVARLLDLPPGTATGAAVGLGATVLAWYPLGRAWDVRGLAAWALTLDTGVLYLAFIATWTLTADAGVLTVAVSGALWLLELFVLLLGAGYVWELVDVLARRHWTGPAAATPVPGARRPFVSLHVPCHDEPPDMVIETVERLLLLDYVDYEVLVVDNNTTDPALWRPLEEFCARHDRVTFLHLEDWPGFKSGALNHALTVTDPRAEVIGIVDADYHVDPDFLADCAPLFADPDVSFVQTPQDYRDWRVSAYFRRLYHSYGYFFDVSQRSRNERNGAIFGGTMGLIRRSSLEQVGGWDEWCITEDAELSLRLLRAGTRGVHIDRAYGRGVMPLSFESLKGQRFRWCFGGIQILRMHWRSLLPGRRTEENRLTLGQRWAYLVGGLQWFGDLAAVVFTFFLLAGAVDAVAGEGLVIRRLSGLILVAVVALVVLGAVRSVALVRRASRASWGEAAGAFGLWLGLGLTVAKASWLGLVSKQGAFLRTPKVKGEPTALDALRGNRTETLLALVCLGVGAAALAAGTPGALAVGALLLLQGVGFALAPLNSLAAIRSDLPEDLRRRRAGMALAAVATPVRRSGTVLAGAAGVLTGFVVLAAPVSAPPGSLDDLPRFPGLESLEEATEPAEPAVGPASRDPRPEATRPSVVGVVAATAGGTAAAAATAPAATARPTRTPSGAPTSGGQPTGTPGSAATTPTTAATTPPASTQSPGKPTA